MSQIRRQGFQLTPTLRTSEAALRCFWTMSRLTTHIWSALKVKCEFYGLGLVDRYLPLHLGHGLEVAIMFFCSKIMNNCSRCASLYEAGLRKYMDLKQRARHDTSHLQPSAILQWRCFRFVTFPELRSSSHSESLSCFKSLSFCITELTSGGNLVF